jgi:hypothetical protein
MFRRVPVRSGANTRLHYDGPDVAAYEIATLFKLCFHDAYCIVVVRWCYS